MHEEEAEEEGGRASPQFGRQHRSRFRGKGLVSFGLGPEMQWASRGEMPGRQVDVPVWALQTGLGRT